MKNAIVKNEDPMVKKILKTCLEDRYVQEKAMEVTKVFDALVAREFSGEISFEYEKVEFIVQHIYSMLEKYGEFKETIRIEGSTDGSYAKLLKHNPVNASEQEFMKNLENAISMSIGAFKVFVCDPSLGLNGTIQFLPGFKPAIYYSHWSWYNMITQTELEGHRSLRSIRSGKKSEWILFLGWLINGLMIEGWSEADAWNAVCMDSEVLRSDNYRTGSKMFLDPGMVLGKCDLVTYPRFLDADYWGDDSRFWHFYIAAGHYAEKRHGDINEARPLSYLEQCRNSSQPNFAGGAGSRGWYCRERIEFGPRAIGWCVLDAD